MTDEERIRRLLEVYEEAVLAAPDADIFATSDGAVAGGIIGGVLKAYRYQRDGSRLPPIWRRGQRLRRAAAMHARAKVRVGQEPLRASFSLPADDNEGGER